MKRTISNFNTWKKLNPHNTSETAKQTEELEDTATEVIQNKDNITDQSTVRQPAA